MSPSPIARPDLRHVEHWIFDLDNTLYPPECEFMVLIEERMTDFVTRTSGLPRDEARALQKKYLHEHGTTLAGLMAYHGIEPHAFLEEVHDVALDDLRPDEGLREALERLPGRRLVFTNGSAKHAERVLDKLGVNDLFEDVFHLEAADFVPKPHPQTFARMIGAHAVDPRAAAFFEDSEKNLKPGRDIGMTTVLVGPHAMAAAGDFIDHKTDRLPPFLNGALLREG